MLLALAKSRADSVRFKWRSMDIGTWASVEPDWQVIGGKIRFQFHGQTDRISLWINSIKPKAWGLNIFLSNPKSPVSDVLEVVWQETESDPTVDSRWLWDTVRQWLRQKFPGHRIISASRRPDLSKTISGLFLRVLFCYRAKNYFLVAADENAGDETRFAISQALLWLSALGIKNRLKSFLMIHFLIPSETSALLAHRCRYLNAGRVRAEVWGYKKESAHYPEIHRAAAPAPEENKDYRWPVLGPFRWSSQLEQVLNLAPDLIRRYPRFHDYDSLRLWGLEFAQVMGIERDRICFGVGAVRTELTDSNFNSLRSLIREILWYRRPDSPDTQHLYYRLQAERWLEALLLEDVPRLFPELVPESVYSQIPVYLGKDPGRIDILGVDRQGTLVVMELKVTPDPDLPLQALDYWGRVVQHNRSGDFTRRGYFSGIRLNRRYPRIYLVSPIFSFHDSTELLLRYLEPDLDIWKVSINDDWRCGVKILRRIQYRCRDLK
jgi:hypothetical protein